MASSTLSLVTGASGFFGSRLVRTLLERGHSVTALCYPNADTLPRSPNLRVLVGDLRDPSLLEQALAETPSCVYHLAGMLATASERQPWLAIEVNLLATLRLFELLKDWGVRLVFASSVSAYGSQVRPPVSEKTEAMPDSYYGITKASVEQWGMFYRRRHRLDFRALRFAAIVAAGQDPARLSSTAFVSLAMERAARGLAYDLPVGPDTTVPVCYWRDALSALLRAGQVETTEHAVFNIGAGLVSAQDVVDVVGRHLPHLRLGFTPDPKVEAAAAAWRNLRIDCSRARRQLGWWAAYDLNAMVLDMIREVRSG